MKVKTILKAAALLAVASLVESISLHAQSTTSSDDLSVMLQAVEQVPPTPGTNAPSFGNFYSAQHVPGTTNEWPPMPYDASSQPFWNLGSNVFLMDDLNYDYSPAATTSSSGMQAMDDSGPPAPPGSGTNGGGVVSWSATPIPTNGLWMQLTNVADVVKRI
jgi:hypothetical protein